MAMLILILAACGGANNPGNTSSNKSSVLNVVPSPKGDWTDGFSPYASSVNNGAQGFIYETLLFFNRMDGSVKPWLAESYEFAADAKSVTFHLRKGVKWSDGTELTADDVVFTLEMLKQYPTADISALWQSLSAVSATDASTVQVTLKDAYTPVLWYLAGQTWIVQKAHYASVGDPNKFVDSKPVGTGPYTLKSFSPQLIDLAKNPNYWQPGKPEVTEIRYPSFNSNTSAELLLTRGDVDWTGLFTPDIEKTFVSKDPAHNHYWFPARNVIMLYLNLAKAPFNQLAVRQALSSAIDREQLWKVAESGYAPVASPTGLVLPANQPFLDSTYSSSAFKLDTSNSDQLLTGLGYAKGSDGIYAKDGKKLSFNLNVVTGWTDWVTACQIMADNFKAIGIEAKVNAVAYNSYFSALQTGDYDMAIHWTNPGPTPWYLYNSLLNSANSADLGKQATSNFERWRDPATDTLLKQYSSTSDEAAQKQALYGLQKIMVEQLPAIPLFFGPTWNEYTSTKFVGWPDANNAYASPAPFDFPDAEIVVLNLKAA